MYTAKCITSFGAIYTINGMTDRSVENLQYAKRSGEVYEATGNDGTCVMVDMAQVAFVEINKQR
jgi:hypothetical protein